MSALLENLRAQLRANLDARAVAQGTLDELLDGVEDRTSFTSEESAAFDAALAAVRGMDDERTEIEGRIGVVAAAEERSAAAAAAAALIPAALTAGAVTVGAEPLTYRQSGEHSFVRDVWAARMDGDPDAQQRLARHRSEMAHEYRSRNGVELRDVGTSAFAGLTVPAYLTDLYAPLAHAGRPFADACRSLPLPSAGMTCEISRITTGTAVASQATQNAGVQETNADDTVLSVPVVTIAGMQDVSRQAIDRATGVDEVVLADLIGAYHAELDRQCIAGSGSSGEHLGVLGVSGINAVTYTDASPTVPEAYPKIADAIQQVASGRYLPADLIVMAPRRWGWFTAALDASSRPLVVPTAAANPAGIGDGGGYGPGVGYLQGLPVVTDGNVPTDLGTGTNEDRVIVCRANEEILWEEPGSPLRLRLEEVLAGQLSVRFVVYGYSAFTAGRYPKAASVISGTGLVTPTF